jgi:putative phosphotransacetylase
MIKKEEPAALSNRHLHLSKEHLEQLFGEGYQLTRFKDLSQPGQYACIEKVDIVGPKGSLKGVRVLGPVRKETQIEISIADGYVLGIRPPIRDSGDLDGTPGVTIIGPVGQVQLEYGVIAAARHIHMHPDDAKDYGVKDFQRVKVRKGGDRATVFENVLIRVSESYALEMHLDVEEGNAADIKNGDMLEIISD